MCVPVDDSIPSQPNIWKLLSYYKVKSTWMLNVILHNMPLFTPDIH